MATSVLPAIDATRASLPPISAILGGLKASESFKGPSSEAKPWKFVGMDCHKPSDLRHSSTSPPASPQFPLRETSPPHGLVLSESDFNKASESKLLDSQSNLPGKRWKQKRDQKYGLAGSGALFARLRTSIQGLQRAIPTESKAVLLQAIQKYLSKEVTPEQFAESIQSLVDEFHVVVPTGPANEEATRQRSNVVESKKRPAQEVPSSMPAVRKSAKKAKVQEIAVAAPVPVQVEEQSAWEALLSVCSRM